MEISTFPVFDHIFRWNDFLSLWLFCHLGDVVQMNFMNNFPYSVQYSIPVVLLFPFFFCQSRFLFVRLASSIVTAVGRFYFIVYSANYYVYDDDWFACTNTERATRPTQYTHQFHIISDSNFSPVVTFRCFHCLSSTKCNKKGNEISMRRNALQHISSDRCHCRKLGILIAVVNLFCAMSRSGCAIFQATRIRISKWMTHTWKWLVSLLCVSCVVCKYMRINWSFWKPEKIQNHIFGRESVMYIQQHLYVWNETGQLFALCLSVFCLCFFFFIDFYDPTVHSAQRTLLNSF